MLAYGFASSPGDSQTAIALADGRLAAAGGMTRLGNAAAAAEHVDAARDAASRPRPEILVLRPTRAAVLG